MKSWIIAASILTAVAAHSRLGETLDQCSQRYGTAPKALTANWYAFEMGPYYIEARIDPSRKVDTLAIQRKFDGQPIGMLASEVRTILSSNSSAVWFETDKTFSSQSWRMEKEQSGNGVTANHQSRTYRWKSRDQRNASYDAQTKVLLISSNPDHPIPPEAANF